MFDMKNTSTKFVLKNKLTLYDVIRRVFFSMIVFSCAITLAHAESRTLSNLERERSSLMRVVVQEGVSPIEREKKIALSQRRLMDMERMVIRDDRLLGSHDLMVRKAFDHYETTFLVHASMEENQHIVDFWLGQLHLDSESILASKRGRR